MARTNLLVDSKCPREARVLRFVEGWNSFHPGGARGDAWNSFHPGGARGDAWNSFHPGGASGEAAELLAKKYGPDIAHALMVNGTIGRYSVMRKFTENLVAEYQAHHILEVARIKQFFKQADPDKFPAVILTKDEHLRITRDLAKESRANIRTVEELWDVYQRVYSDYPHWLDAIRPYFKVR